MPLTSVMYELASECPKCKAALPINGATESVQCAACQNVVDTPPDFFRTILAEATGEAVGMEETTGRNATMILGQYGVTVKAQYGRLKARCECKADYPVEALAQELASGDGQIFCGACGKKASVRKAPAWFAEVHPSVTGFVRESHGGDTAKAEDPASIRFHCYHCGGAMPLDGDARSVNCKYCHHDLMVPDEIWVRLHPVATVERWFALLDLGGGVGVVPEETSDFCDFTVHPAGHMVLAWHADDEGEVGHPCRVAAADRKGVLLWIQDGVTFSDDAELLVSGHDASIVLVDEEEGFVRFLDSKDGTPIRTLKSPDEDAGGTGLNVNSNDGVTVAWDGSLVVRRYWDDGEHSLRRFGPDGTRMPLWPGQPVSPEEPDDYPEWNELGAQPLRIPDDTKFKFGWDGAFYVVDEKLRYIAKLSADGQLFGVMETGVSWCEEVKEFDVSRDGTIYAVLEHAEKLRDDEWAHVARIREGRVELWLGPHVEGSPMVGQYDQRLEVLPDGTVFLGGYDIDSLRIIGPDGSEMWKSNATRRNDEGWLTEKLEKLRRGKKLVADRE